MAFSGTSSSFVKSAPDDWEQMGALPMCERKAARLLKSCQRATAANPNTIVAHAPFFEVEGIGRLVIHGTTYGADKRLVALSASVTPARAVSVTLKTDGKPMGLPMTGYDGQDAASYFGDPNSGTKDVAELTATLYSQGYAAMSLARTDGSRHVMRGLISDEIVMFAGICLGVISSKKQQ